MWVLYFWNFLGTGSKNFERSFLKWLWGKLHPVSLPSLYWHCDDRVVSFSITTLILNRLGVWWRTSRNLWIWCCFWVINRWCGRLVLLAHWRSSPWLKVCRSQISSFCSLLECVNYGILNSICEYLGLINHCLMHCFGHHVLKPLRIGWKGDLLRRWQRSLLEDSTFSVTVWC
jgi:hypothetical protein